MFKVNNRNTRTNCETCSRFVRTAIEHIRISQLLQDFNLGIWTCIFKLSKIWRHTNLFANQIFIYFKFCFSFIEIIRLELYVASLKYPPKIYLFKLHNRHARMRCGLYSALVIKTTEQRQESFYLYDTGF